ncbi:unnamed protein product [Brugia pahangi]|uniref:Transcription initiation factor TFIID subunit 13 n=1 Tax=Brugia pahangi TaxID=6280 RepID=A0A0N4TCE1_BRUPA|nr:unnamed protein product [Brugia pahangi]
MKNLQARQILFTYANGDHSEDCTIILQEHTKSFIQQMDTIIETLKSSRNDVANNYFSNNCSRVESVTNSWDVAVLNSDKERCSDEVDKSSVGCDEKMGMKCDSLHSDISKKTDEDIEDVENTKGNTEQNKDKSDNSETLGNDEVMELVRNSKIFVCNLLHFV